MAKYETFRRYPGVRAYLSPNRKTQDGKPDKCFYIRYKDARGKLVEEKVGWLSEGITASYASGLRAERIRSIRLGDEVIPTQRKKKVALTFNDFMEEKYFPWAHTSKKSWKDEEGLYKRWIQPEIGGKLLKDVAPFDLERIKMRMEEAGKAPRTIRYALDVVRMAFYRARDWGIYEGPNPATKVKRPQKDNRRLRFLTPEEAQKLLSACQMKSQQLYEMALLALHCGLRAGEIFNSPGEMWISRRASSSSGIPRTRRTVSLT